MAEDFAKLPEDGGGFEAKVDVGVGIGERLAGGVGLRGLGGPGRKVGGCECDEGGVVGELGDGGFPALGFFGPEEGHKLREAFCQPGGGGGLGGEAGMGEGADEFGRNGFGCGVGGERGGEEGFVFEWRAGVVEQRDRRGGGGAEPGGEECLDLGGGGRVRLGEFRIGGDDGEELAGGLDGVLGGEEEAGGAQAEGASGKVGRGDAVRLVDELVVGIGEASEGLGMAVEDCGVGWVAEVLDGEAEVEEGGGKEVTLTGDEVEEAVAFAESRGGGGDGIPEDIAEAAKCGGGDVGGGRDGVPVGLGGAGGVGAE